MVNTTKTDESFEVSSDFGDKDDSVWQIAHTAKPDSGSGRVYNWERFASSLLKSGNWARLGQLAKSMNILPDDISGIFDKLEKNSTITLDHEKRLLYYQDFTRSALGSTTLHSREIEGLILRRNPEIQINHNDLHTLITSKLELSAAGSKVSSEHNDYFDFENYASLIYDLLYYHSEKTRVQRTKGSSFDIFRQLPLDPDSGRKQVHGKAHSLHTCCTGQQIFQHNRRAPYTQVWDLVCLLLLLYCSFSVPYSLAFDDSEKGVVGNLSLMQVGPAAARRDARSARPSSF